MNMHNTFATIINGAMFNGALLILSGIILSSNAVAKQTVLLDANGQPLSDEVLMLLSLSSGRLNTTKPAKKITKEVEVKNASKKPKRNKPLSNPLLEIELFNALKTGKTQRAKQLLKIGTSPTHKSLEGETPLGIAVSRGWASMVIDLIDNGADINEKGARGVTLLHIASANGLIDVAKVLVKQGLKPGKKTDKNWTPLHVAARYGHWQLVQYFLSVGVDPDIRNSDGKTALGLARHLKHQGIIKILSRVTTVRSLDFVKVKTSKKNRKKRRKSKRK